MNNPDVAFGPYSKIERITLHYQVIIGHIQSTIDLANIKSDNGQFLLNIVKQT